MRATKICSDDNPCDTIPFLQRALPLAKLGLRVHPLEPRDKKPLLKGYKTIATPDQAALMAWADEYPTANVGIIVGERIIGESSTHYVVLDIDNRRHGHTSLATLEQMHPVLPMTWQVQTGDGQHIYLALPEHVTVPTREQTDAMSKRASKELAPGIEMLTAGCNLVARTLDRPDRRGVDGTVAGQGDGRAQSGFLCPDSGQYHHPGAWS